MSDATVSETVRLCGTEADVILEGAFPGPCCSAGLRVWMSPEAHGLIVEHARSDSRIELCGVLVGQVLRDDRGPFLVVEDIVRGKDADTDPARVTFTQRTWAHIFSELDSKHSGKRILGWYHTHPGFGVFMSPMDTFIQENFFNLPWQVAFVIDPFSGDEGLFHWRDGKIVRASSYWIGDFCCIARPWADARANKPLRGDPGPARKQPPTASAEPDARPRVRHMVWDVAHTMLLILVLLVLLFQPQVQHILWSLIGLPK